MARVVVEEPALSEIALSNCNLINGSAIGSKGATYSVRSAKTEAAQISVRCWKLMLMIAVTGRTIKTKSSMISIDVVMVQKDC